MSLNNHYQEVRFSFFLKKKFFFFLILNYNNKGKREEEKLKLEEYEDLRLQRLSASNMSNSALRNFIEDIIDQKFYEFSEFGAYEFLDLVEQNIKDEDEEGVEKLNEKSLLIIQALGKLIESCPNMSTPLYILGIVEIQKRIPFQLFFETKDMEMISGMIKLVCILYEICPGYSNWKELVPITFQDQVSERLKGIKPANKRPTLNDLGARLNRQSAYILWKLGKKEEDKGIDKFNQEISTTMMNPLGEIIKNIMKVLSQHTIERQKEIIDNAEKLAVRDYQNAMMRLKSSNIKDKALIEARKKSLENLFLIHEERHQRKKERFNERIELLKGLIQDGDEEESQMKAYKNSIEFLIEGIKQLEETYKFFKDLAMREEKDEEKLHDVGVELCYLSGKIGEFYEISVSFAVVGSISCGKSTMINCLVGDEVAPERVESMTSIPVRYIHNPIIGNNEAVLLVPFSSQLNLVSQKICEIIQEYSIQEGNNLEEGLKRLKNQLSKTHLKTLVDKIDKGLIFEDKYVGNEKVLDALRNIHDLFRLSVEQVFGNELIGELPLKWSEGLDKYLTVYLSFPEFEATTGLLELSIIDTPGIDEYGVKRLNLNNVIRDTLYSSNFGLMVTSPSTYNAQSLNPLKQQLFEAKKKWNTPIFGFITHSDQSTAKSSENRVQDFCNSCQFSNQPLFDQKDVFLVSSNRYFIGTRMLKFLSKEGRKPNLKSENGMERKLAQDWAISFGYGDDDDAKRDYYDSIEMKPLEERCNKLIEISKMKEPLKRLINISIEKGIEVGTRSTLLKYAEKLEERRNSQIESTQTQTRDLTKSFETFQSTLIENSQNAKKLIEEYQQKIVHDSIILGQVSKSSNNNTDFIGYFDIGIQKTQDVNIKSLIFESNNVSFKSQTEAEKTLCEIKYQLEKSIETQFQVALSKLPETIISRSLEKRKETETKISKLKSSESNYQEELENNYSLNNFEFNFSANPALQPIIKSQKSKAIRSVLPQLLTDKSTTTSEEVVIDSKAFKQYLIQESKSIIKLTSKICEEQVNQLVENQLNPLFNEIQNLSLSSAVY